MNKKELIIYYYQEIYKYIQTFLPNLTFSGTIYSLDYLLKSTVTTILENTGKLGNLLVKDCLDWDFDDLYSDIKDII